MLKIYFYPKGLGLSVCNVKDVKAFEPRDRVFINLGVELIGVKQNLIKALRSAILFVSYDEEIQIDHFKITFSKDAQTGKTKFVIKYKEDEKETDLFDVKTTTPEQVAIQIKGMIEHFPSLRI
jgi:hypothetical protein